MGDYQTIDTYLNTKVLPHKLIQKNVFARDQDTLASFYANHEVTLNGILNVKDPAEMHIYRPKTIAGE